MKMSLLLALCIIDFGRRRERENHSYPCHKKNIFTKTAHQKKRENQSVYYLFLLGRRQSFPAKAWKLMSFVTWCIRCPTERRIAFWRNGRKAFPCFVVVVSGNGGFLSNVKTSFPPFQDGVDNACNVRIILTALDVDAATRIDPACRSFSSPCRP